jgi:hypothetical protein
MSDDAKKITKKTMIPLGLVVTIGGSLFGYVRSVEGRMARVEADSESLKYQQTKEDVRWERVDGALTSIQVRLGIVEKKK